MKQVKFKTNIFFEKKYHPISDSEKFFSCQVNKKDLKLRLQFILSLICEHAIEVSFKFCDSEEMIAANSFFRKKDYATDVLSFVPTDSLAEENACPYLGDILICLPVCASRLKKQGQTLAAELERMIIHGILHLKGFDHERSLSAWKVMTHLEKQIQKELISIMDKPAWITIEKG